MIAVVNNQYPLLEEIRTGKVESTPKKLEFQFIHDRVQQAAYQLIPEETSAQIHLKVGRLLLEQFHETKPENEEKNLFELLYHFNKDVTLVTDQEESYNLAKLNLIASKKAKTSTAYQSALNYLQSGMKFLKVYDWNKNYHLLFEFYQETAECLFLLKQFEEAENYIVELLRRCNNAIDSAQVYLIKIRAYVNAAKHKDVIILSRIALKLFNFDLPLKPTALHISREIFLIKWRNRRWNNQKIKNPTTSTEILMMGQLLANVSSSAYQVNQNLFAYVACKLMNISFCSGYMPETPLACFGYAIILVAQFNQIDEAFRFVNLAKEIQKKSENKISIAKNNFIMGALINHWKYPLHTSIKYMEKAYYAGIEEGDLAFSVYSRLMGLVMYYSGNLLSKVQENVQESISFSHFTGNNDFHHVFLAMRSILLFLAEEHITFETELKTLIDINNKNENKTTAIFVDNLITQFYYIRGDYFEAKEISNKAYASRNFVKGGFDYIFTLLFHGLCLATDYPLVNKKTQSEYYQRLKIIQKQFKLWSNHCKANFLYAYWLISAEIERLNKKFYIKTIRSYNKAISEAEKHGYIQFVAISNECAARFCFDSKYPTFGKVYLQNAYYAYLRWGAIAKCKRLQKQYPEILPSYTNLISTAIPISSNLELLQLFKTAQEISQEIHLEKLLKKIMGILLKNFSVEKTALISIENNNCFILSQATKISEKILLPATELMENRTDLPSSLITHVQKNQELLVTRTAQELEKYNTTDPYLKTTQPQSILILPIIYQDTLRDLIYLENKDKSHAFTPANIQILKVLASQMAISLENARLYYQATRQEH